MADVATLLPINATALEMAVEQATARIGAVDVSPVGELWDAQTCPTALLPWLAWAVGVDSWNSGWTEATKRSVIAAAPMVHRLRGTAAAVKTAVAAFGAGLSMQEWFEQQPKGAPGTFAVVLTVGAQSGEEAAGAFVNDVIVAISMAKNTRSHFTFTTGVEASASIGLFGLARVASFARLSAVAQ